MSAGTEWSRNHFNNCFLPCLLLLPSKQGEQTIRRVGGTGLPVRGGNRISVRRGARFFSNNFSRIRNKSKEKRLKTQEKKVQNSRKNVQNSQSSRLKGGGGCRPLVAAPEKNFHRTNFTSFKRFLYKISIYFTRFKLI